MRRNYLFITFLLTINMLFLPYNSFAKSRKGRTAQELENSYIPTPSVKATPGRKTRQSIQKDTFYKRYFRKGKEIKQAEDLGTDVEDKQLLLQKLMPVHTPTPEGDPRAGELKKLIYDLGCEHHRRQAAVERLAMIGQPAVPALLSALKDPYKFKRKGALQALGYIQPLEAAPSIQKLLRDPESVVRGEAVKVLGRMKHKPSVDSIIKCLQDPDKRVRREAVVALGRLKGLKAGDGLIRALHNPYAEIRQAACDELSFFTGKKVVAALLETTQDKNRDTCMAAVRALGEIGDAIARPRLQKLTQSEDNMIRQEAIQALKNIPDTNGISAP